MELDDIQKKFAEEVKYVDDLSQIVLKGHLVLESIMDNAIELYFINPEHLLNARFKFSQKIELCRGMSLRESQNNMWNLIKKINVLRNSLSHSLDGNRRERAVQSLMGIYDQEFPSDSRKVKDMSEDSALCLAAITGSLGFLHSFASDMKKFKSLIIDNIV
ncbi:hypothetical protein M9194_19615 [Vibrio sp. S4M6]|uniref:hypothetical protein n=1 Tax=Vibrio sinus TaxID=2946865 RepID=UPI00202AA336|nr:hypothetical protein [Vibrio sinus]MCL9783636.1 hypothetical protein [Vibrio sinus]